MSPARGDARIPGLADVDRELVRRRGLREFAKLAWPTVEPADELQWNWHHDAICEHAEAVLRGQIRDLVICVPPGMTKSMLVSVMLSAFAWTERPEHRIIAIAQRGDLARRDSRKVRGLVQSQWFRERWPDATLVKDGEDRLENDRTGFRIIGSVRSGVIGERGNLLVIDDPLSREDAESRPERQRTSEFVWETLPTRLTNFSRDGKILIMQRLHRQDTAGEAIDRGWESLVLPNEFEPRRCCTTSLGFSDPRAGEGELLHPERFGRAETDKMKSDLGTTTHAGQYQQRPAPREGAIVKVSWLSRRYGVRGERPRRLIQSWDCASKPRERNDPSACVTLAEFDDRVELWDAEARRVEFPDLVRRAKDKFAAFTPRPNVVLVEDKDAGQQLIQQLRADTTSRLPVVAMVPDASKETRMATETPLMEGGKFWLPDQAPWVADYVDELTTFPAGLHDDLVDATSQALRWIRENPLRSASAPAPVGVAKPSARAPS